MKAISCIMKGKEKLKKDETNEMKQFMVKGKVTKDYV